MGRGGNIQQLQVMSEECEGMALHLQPLEVKLGVNQMRKGRERGRAMGGGHLGTEGLKGGTRRGIRLLSLTQIIHKPFREVN